MNEKKYRLRIIKKLIKENKIDSQEKLLAMLEAENVAITQATLSRDLKLIKVSKVSDGSKGYYYSLLEEELQKVSEEKYIMDINRGFLTINFSGNIGIIRTFSGHANTVALALDTLEIDEILGTVAGDDTVLIVLQEKITSSDFLKKLRERFPTLDL
ncbi:MAG: ArgR family transcriptional regulator [Spirochaetaceae bacterium]|nr:ArgR family transcriptional regulator [Spirochaetaceae bacterium]